MESYLGRHTTDVDKTDGDKDVGIRDDTTGVVPAA